MIGQIDAGQNSIGFSQLGQLNGPAFDVTEFLLMSSQGPPVFVGARPADSVLMVFEVNAATSNATVLWQMEDSEKTTLREVTDLLQLSINSTDFVVAASSLDNGLSTFAVLPDSSLDLRDTLGPADGLWANGIDAIEAVSCGGNHFVVASSASAGAIIAIRVNPVGAMFMTDITYDTLESRFAGALALDSFTYSGRSFVVAGGSDLGLSLFEVSPTGTLYLMDSIAQSTSWDIGNIQSITTEVIGTNAKVLVSGATAAILAQIDIPLAGLGATQQASNLGATLVGSQQEDFLIGGNGNDVLSGFQGNDRLIDGAGTDYLTGGGGDDVFVFVKDGARDTVSDFHHRYDALDLSDWGRIYHISALQITPTANGATVSWMNEVIDLYSFNGASLTPDLLTNDNFIF